MSELHTNEPVACGGSGVVGAWGETNIACPGCPDCDLPTGEPREDVLKECMVCGTMKHIPNGRLCARCWAADRPPTPEGSDDGEGEVRYVKDRNTIAGLVLKLRAHARGPTLHEANILSQTDAALRRGLDLADAMHGKAHRIQTEKLATAEARVQRLREALEKIRDQRSMIGDHTYIARRALAEDEDT